jgi:dihydroorotase
MGDRAVDVLIDGGRIAAIGADLPAGSAEELEGRGRILLPGLVDLHTHLREPGREDAETVESGTRAAALGGYTCVHAMANTDPVADTAAVVEQVWRLGREAAWCEVRPVGAVTVGLDGEQLAELGTMADSAAAVRVFSDDGRCVSDALLMRRALEYVKAFDGVIAQRAWVCAVGPASRRIRSSRVTSCSLSTSAPACTCATSPLPGPSRS